MVGCYFSRGVAGYEEDASPWEEAGSPGFVLAGREEDVRNGAGWRLGGGGGWGLHGLVEVDQGGDGE